ncbi:hypothetical protein Emed_002947 [Eimeria media]
MKIGLLILGFLVAASLALCANNTQTAHDPEVSDKDGETVTDRTQTKPVSPEGEEAEAAPTSSEFEVMENRLYTAAATVAAATAAAAAAEDARFVLYVQTTREHGEPAETDATYAVHSQTGTTASCSAAVEYWKGAIENFESLPPEHDNKTDLYNDRRNVSFVALFNPQADAKVDCVYVTCPKKTEDSSGSSNDNSQGADTPLNPQPQPVPDD